MQRGDSHPTLRGATVAGAMTGLVVSGCGQIREPDEPDRYAELLEQSYDGRYDESVDRLSGYEGEFVTVQGDVETLFSPTSFSISGPGAEPLLVVGTDIVEELEEDVTVEVIGIVRESFDLPTVEGQLEEDLGGDAAFEPYNEEPYLEALDVDVLA